MSWDLNPDLTSKSILHLSCGPASTYSKTNTYTVRNSRNSVALAHKVNISLAGPKCQLVPWKPTTRMEANPMRSGPGEDKEMLFWWFRHLSLYYVLPTKVNLDSKRLAKVWIKEHSAEASGSVDDDRQHWWELILSQVLHQGFSIWALLLFETGPSFVGEDASCASQGVWQHLSPLATRG